MPGGVLHAQRATIREDAALRNKAIYLALGVVRTCIVHLIRGSLSYAGWKAQLTHS